LLSADNIAFPLLVTDNQVPPSDLIIYVCFDAGGDNTTDCGAGEGDIAVLFDEGTAVTFEEAMIDHLAVELETGVSTHLGEESAEDAGCESETPDGLGSVTVTLSSTTITPEAGDTASVSLFTVFPPAGAPSYNAGGPVESFPAERSLATVDPGEYYVMACFDAGGDSMMCNGEGDVAVWYMDGASPATVEPDTELTLSMSFDVE
jgi:hypothetical protein